MNILKALEGLSPDKAAAPAQAETEQSAPSAKAERREPAEKPINVMASVLERHEIISNRVRNGK